MGGEEEIVRIAKRLDKMVAKKSAVSGGPPPPHTHSPAVGRGQLPPEPRFFGVGRSLLGRTPLRLSFHSGAGGPPCCPSPGRVLKGG